MNMSPVNLRNLEQIHEGAGSRSPRLATLLLAATGATAVLVVGMAMRDRQPAVDPVEKDPLAALVASAAQEKQDEGVQLRADELDFPEVLSDADARTTALVAVKDKDGHLLETAEELPSDPPPATDSIPVVPLPAGTLLSATSVTKSPKDELSQMAAQVARTPDGTALAPPGSEGGYVVQVASFKEQDDADSFVTELRSRGHQAFRVAASVPDRGIWHRVRIGSFKTKYEADRYKEKLERNDQVRAAKLAERIRKYGSE
jgi:DedD protein